MKELWSHFRYLCVFYILQNVLETLTHPHCSCPKQIIKKGLVMFHRPESKFMGRQYRNHCPILSQKSGERPSGNEKQAWRTEINNYRIKINSFRKSVKEDQNPHQIWQCAELAVAEEKAVWRAVKQEIQTTHYWCPGTWATAVRVLKKTCCK